MQCESANPTAREYINECSHMWKGMRGHDGYHGEIRGRFTCLISVAAYPVKFCAEAVNAVVEFGMELVKLSFRVVVMVPMTLIGQGVFSQDARDGVVKDAKSCFHSFRKCVLLPVAGVAGELRHIVGVVNPAFAGFGAAAAAA